MYKFTRIQAFYQVDKYLDTHKKLSPVVYRGSVKLHGTNAGVACSSEGLVAQSRNRVLTADDDNCGFASFIEQPPVTSNVRNLERRLREAHHIKDQSTVVLFGEWIGAGIHHGVAVNQLPTKQWVLFAVKVIEGDKEEYIDAVPVLGMWYSEVGIYSVADVPQYELTVDFTDEESKQNAIDYATFETGKVEACCPWGKHFGVEGIGEGIVWFPIEEHFGDTDYFFKTKGPKHRVTKPKVSTQLTPEVLQNAKAFVEFAVTENRLTQGIEYLKEMGYELDMTSLGHYLKWVGGDVKEECALELESNGLVWKHVAKTVAFKAKGFYIVHTGCK